MNYILFDHFRRNNLLPLTFTRPVCEIRLGILTIREKWEHLLGSPTSTLTEQYLSKKYPIKKAENNILINASVCPTDDLVKQVKALRPNQALVKDRAVIAMHVLEKDLDMTDKENEEVIEEIEILYDLVKINHTWDIFTNNGAVLTKDFELVTRGRKSQPLSNTNKVTGEEIFIEEGARVEHAIINATGGPVYIGRDAEIMEGAMIRGPFALCEKSVLKMGAKIYGPTTIGPHSKIGGEVNNSVILGYSNKAHDGFLGQSVIGEWCNLGADTNNSNLKNNYEPIRVWNYPDETFIDTGLQFCGLIMGDHSKSGINTMFNTGTVVGVSSNIFGPGFQRNFIPSFSWGGTHGFTLYRFEKAADVAARVYGRRNKEFDQYDRDILKHVYNLTMGNESISV